MHGVIHRTLKQYVDDRMTEGAWERVRDHAGVEPKLYLPVSHYPDEEFDAFLGAIADLTGYDEDTILEDFGRFLAPELMQTFRAHLRDDWDLFDLLERLPAVFEQIENQNADNDLPNLNCNRVVSDMLVLTYTSERRMCRLGRGVIRGTIDYHDERAAIAEDRCMLEGDGHCEFTITLEEAADEEPPAVE